MADLFGPIEILATNDTWRDPAIDMQPNDAEDADHPRLRLETYREWRKLDALRLRAGVNPTLFVVKPLTATYIASVIDPYRGDGFRFAMCFAASCHEIKRADGSVLKPTGKLARGAKGSEIADDSWIDTVAAEFGLDTVYEVGAVAYQRGKLPRGSAVPFDWQRSRAAMV